MLGINLGTGDVHSEHTKDPCVYEFIGIPGRYFRFSSRLPQLSEYHSKASHTIFLVFPMCIKVMFTL